MCGIIGVYLEKITPAQLEKVNHLILESSIRGIHATGVSFLQRGKITTIKSHLPAEKFIQERSLGHFKESDGGLYLLAHTRYSTSDLRYNQPIGDEELVISHNGVISQGDPKIWESLFGFKTKTTNDSELIYVACKAGAHPLKVFRGSIAVCILQNKQLNFYRNEQRPLWFCQELNGVVVASTKDILLRSGFQNPQECKMFTEYCCREGTLTSKEYPTPLGVMDLQ